MMQVCFLFVYTARTSNEGFLEKAAREYGTAAPAQPLHSVYVDGAVAQKHKATNKRR